MSNTPVLESPKIRISFNYPGASAQTLGKTVTQIIEQNITGLDNLLYMASQSTNTGRRQHYADLLAGSDPNEAMQQVQNQLQAPQRRLPQVLQSQGMAAADMGIKLASAPMN